MEIYELARTRVEVEARRGYVHAVLRGECSLVEDVLHLTSLAVRVMDRHDERRLLVDARALPDHLPTDACHAALQWLGEGLCRQVAWVVPQAQDSAAAELVVTRINMTSLSSSLPLRAFAAIIEAHRWLGGDRRASSTMNSIRPGELASAVERAKTPPGGSPAQRPLNEGRSSGTSGSWSAVRPESPPSTRPPTGRIPGGNRSEG